MSTIFFVLLLSGCVPRVANFYYISLENVAGIEVVREGKVEIEGLFWNSVIPLEYELQRSDYIISLEVLGRHQPTLKFQVKTEDGLRLRVEESTKLDPITNKSGRLCGHFIIPSTLQRVPPELIPYMQQLKSQDMEFSWLATCASEFKREMVFNVLNEEGSVIGTEIIQFEVVEDGFLGYWDAV